MSNRAAVIEYLSRVGGRVRTAEVARGMGIDPVRAGHILADMRRDGIIRVVEWEGTRAVYEMGCGSWKTYENPVRQWPKSHGGKPDPVVLGLETWPHGRVCSVFDFAWRCS